MNARKTAIRAALGAALLAAGAAGAQYVGGAGGVGGIEQEGGVQTPKSIEQPVFNKNIPGGVNAIPRANNPQNPNEALPFVQQPEGVRPLVRGDNPNLPNPVTPSAANESQPLSPLHDTTNMSGMEGAPVGGTR